MNGEKQTTESDRSATIAFRTSEQVKHLVRAVAARRDEFPSEWLRRAIRDQLQGELGSQLEAATGLDGGEVTSDE